MMQWRRRSILLLLAAIGSGDAMANQGDLHRAAAANDAARVTALLAGGTAIDARDSAGRTALLLATHANAIDAARVLIAAGADVNAKDGIEDTPYLYAAAEGRLEILRLTLAAGADLKSTNRYGGTGLIPAAHHGHPAIVRELLRTKINVDHVNRLGWTALLETIILSDGGAVHVEILTLLINAGADVSLADRDGVTPLAHARRRGYREMTALLEAKGARE
ncbi:ankyrin repeat domain-containing protein [Reyranella sp. CPCC 100927]|nr:ankyrin repeat domain-containing protein [Reyranella sp. CPCC 100927]